MLRIIQISLLLVLVVFVFRFLRYISTPLLKKIGFYKYYSPLFCTMPFFKNHLDIHLGTSWDFFRIGKLNPRKILLYLAEGLLNLSKAVERGEINGDKILRGNVFYLKSGTFEKYGFKARKLNFIEFVLFLANYLELCILQSISTGKISLVSFKNLSILTCRAEVLPQYSVKLEAVVKHLRKDEVKKHAAAPKNENEKTALQKPELVFID